MFHKLMMNESSLAVKVCATRAASEFVGVRTALSTVSPRMVCHSLASGKDALADVTGISLS